MKRYPFILSILGICVIVVAFSNCKKSSSSPQVVNIDTSNNIIMLANIDSTSLVLPTAFTPNGDGKNDVYRAIASYPNRLSSYSLTVFESNGTPVFQTSSISGAWDGKVKGVLDVNYRYEVHVTCTTVSGKTLNAWTFLFLLPTNTPEHCVLAKPADIVSYVFPDQVDPVSGTSPYSTAEVMCN